MNKMMKNWIGAALLLGLICPLNAMAQDDAEQEVQAEGTEQVEWAEQQSEEDSDASDAAAEPEPVVEAPAEADPEPEPAADAPPVMASPRLKAAPTAAPKKKERLRIKLRATSSVHGLENLDFRDLDESSDRDIIDSDDRRFFGHSDIMAKVQFRASEGSFLNVQTKYDAVWKEEQLGRTEGSTGDLNFYQLNMTHFLSGVANEKGQCTKGSGCITVVIGRQPF